VTVVERAPELRPGGQAVDARGVAKEVIARMGLAAAVRTACTDTAGAYTVDVAGNVLETYRADDDGGDGFIAEIEILRGDLSQVLYDDTRDGVEYVFDDRIAELTQDADGVDVAFAAYERRMRSFVEANQEIGRLHSRTRDVPGPDAEPSIDFESEWFTELLGRAINGVELPDCAGVPDSATPTGSSITSPAGP
jgi:hypothetical protein